MTTTSCHKQTNKTSRTYLRIRLVSCVFSIIKIIRFSTLFSQFHHHHHHCGDFSLLTSKDLRGKVGFFFKYNKVEISSRTPVAFVMQGSVTSPLSHVPALTYLGTIRTKEANNEQGQAFRSIRIFQTSPKPSSLFLSPGRIPVADVAV